MIGSGGFSFVIFPSFPLAGEAHDAVFVHPHQLGLGNSVAGKSLELHDLFAIEELLAGADGDDGTDRRGARERFRRIIFPGRSFAGRQELIGADGNGRENKRGGEK